MSTVGFRLAAPSKGSGGKMPLTVEKAMAAAYAEAQGALVIVDGSNKYAACGADPATIAGVTVCPGGTDTSGFIILGTKEFPPGYMQAYALAGQKFLAPYIGALPATPGGRFGVVRDTDGVWKVDFNDDINVVLTHIDTPDFSPADASGSGQDVFVLVQFLASVIADL